MRGENINTSIERAKQLQQMAKEMRLDGLEMALASGNYGSHLGGSFSCMEILSVLYGEVLRFPEEREERDLFLPSKNHCVLAHLPALARSGFFPREELFEFQKDGGRLTGYPMRPEIGLEYSGGSLGMAISVGIGMALAAKERGSNRQIYVLMGDGELQEGCVWEAILSAVQFRLDNLIVIIDRNHLSFDGETEHLMALDSIEEKFQSFHWYVTSCDGHDTKSLLEAFAKEKKGVPHVIIADTVKGKGVSFMEGNPQWHHHRLTKEEYEIARSEVEASC